MPTDPPNRYFSAPHTALVLPGAFPNDGRKAATYQPLPSVWDGEDSALLEQMLSFYPSREPELILDATLGGGRFWKNSRRPVIGMDMRVRTRPSVVGDNSSMPFRSSSFDVVVYDPPHVPNQGKDKLKDFNDRFGLGVRSTKENGYSFAHTFPPFLKEAYEILKPDGVLFGKVTDYVHDHRYQWAHVDLIKAAEAIGFVACDCIIKVRKGPIVDPKWKNAHHSRRRHAYWLVFRKSRDCE
jgi:SAM-dependent methyltransferase